MRVCEIGGVFVVEQSPRKETDSCGTQLIAKEVIFPIYIRTLEGAGSGEKGQMEPVREK